MTRKKVKDEKVEEVKIKNVEEINEDSLNEMPLKEEKKKRIIDEFKSFIILAVIICLVILGGWLFYKYAKPIEHKDNNVVESEGYKTVVYKSEKGSLEVVGDKYLIEYDGDKLVKIMNLYSETLYEAINDEYYDFIMGVDGNLYAIEYLDYESMSGIFNLYVFENNKLVLVREFIDEQVSGDFIYHSPINDISYVGLSEFIAADANLIGFYGHKNYMDEELNDIEENYFYKLDGREFDLKNIRITGDTISPAEGTGIFTANDRYIIVVDSEGLKYGLYDLKEGEIVIEPSYDDLYTTSDGNYVAIKNGKAGIINRKLKILVDFKYDFIDINDGFYVVAKNGKMAVMNSDFKLLTDFVFDVQGGYDYRLCCSNYNFLKASKIDSKYILTINDYELDPRQAEEGYKKSETYIIDKTGKYKTIKANRFELFDSYAYGYLKDSKKLVIYETKNFDEISTIDLSDYDYEFDGYTEVSIAHNGIVTIVFDSELYFDVNTGTELSENDIIYNEYLEMDGNVRVKYNLKDKKAIILLNDKEVSTINIKDDYGKFKGNSDNLYFYTSKEYVLIEKR